MVKQPNQRVCFQFGGFKNLVFEFHKARIKRTRGSESWFLSQWTVNRCVCVHACTLGVHRLSKVVARTCVASTNQLPDSELPAGSCQADLSADILTIWRGSCLLFTPPFPHLPPYSPVFLLWWKNSWGPNQGTLWNTDTEKAKCSNDWQKLPFNSDSF